MLAVVAGQSLNCPVYNVHIVVYSLSLIVLDFAASLLPNFPPNAVQTTFFSQLLVKNIICLNCTGKIFPVRILTIFNDHLIFAGWRPSRFWPGRYGSPGPYGQACWRDRYRWYCIHHSFYVLVLQSVLWIKIHWIWIRIQVQIRIQGYVNNLKVINYFRENNFLYFLRLYENKVTWRRV